MSFENKNPENKHEDNRENKDGLPPVAHNLKADSAGSKKIGRSALNGMESLVVGGLFLIFYNILNLIWAISVTTAASVWFTYSRYRRGVLIGKLLPIVAIFFIGKGLAGIITGSEDVFFLIEIGQGAAVGLVLIVSVFLKRNLLLPAIPYIFDFSPETKAHPIYKKTLNTIALAVGGYFVVKVSFDFWLLDVTSSANIFKIVKTGMGWAGGLAIFWGSILYAAKRFAKIPNFEGFAVLIERHAEIYKDALRDRFRFARIKKKPA